jgi:hypothetical protein
MAKKVATKRTPVTDTPAAEVPPPTTGHYTKPETYQFLILLVAILVAIAWAGLRLTQDRPATAYFVILALMAAFVIVTGRAVTKLWRGILIDARNKLSLSRLQMIGWTLVVLSAIVTAALANISYNSDSPLDIEVPSELWVLMGISTGSLVASPAILSNKAQRPARTQDVEAMKKVLGVKEKSIGLLACNNHPEDARWADLLMGEEVGNFRHVDLGKLQMFLFTFILVLSYAAAIAAMFREAGVIEGLPKVEDGMNVLLGISHTGYLANKTLTHTKEGSPDA